MKKKILENADLLMTAGLVLITFAVYCGTLCPDGHTGEAAAAAARVSGVSPGTWAGHPLWLAVSRAAARLPVRNVPFALALFNAVCGAAAVGLLFRVAKRFLDELTRPRPEFGGIPDADVEEKTPEEDAGEDNREMAVTFGGVVVALAFAFCAPFWRASVSLSVHPADILLMLLLADLLLRCQTSGRCVTCAAAMFLCGAGIVESPVFLPLLPVAVAVVMREVIRSRYGSEPGVPLCLLAWLAGVAANLGLGSLQFEPGAEGGAGFLREFARAYRMTLCRGVFPSGWVFIWVVPAATFFISVLGVRIVTLWEENADLAGWALFSVPTGGAVANMLNLPHTAGAAAGAGDSLPVLPGLMAALAAGCLFVFWFKAAGLCGRGECGYGGRPPALLRASGLGACWLLAVAALAQPCITVWDVKTADNGPEVASTRVVR